MKLTMRLRNGVTIEESMKILEQVAERDARIQRDPHTNRHYELKGGRIWKKGDGTGMYWELLCNSRKAQRQAMEMMRT